MPLTERLLNKDKQINPIKISHLFFLYIDLSFCSLQASPLFFSISFDSFHSLLYYLS